ncbi:MAG TPA: MFS transporter [Candidatus Nanopelagicaceae bacterium]|nr:MFS transporter [Candidatus Nanopelagicaceae bacterium]
MTAPAGWTAGEGPGDLPKLPQSVRASADPEGLGRVALALVLVAAFVVVLDFSIVNLALASIQRELGFSATSLQWVVTAYAITFGGFLILGGGLADRYGRRRIFVVGLVVFTSASLVGGLASGPGLLVAARAIQGIGAAIVAPAALALITSGYRQGGPRNRALGLYGATASVGFVGGLVLGGMLVQLLGWRAVFFVNVPVGLVAAGLALRYLPKPAHRAVAGALDVGGGLLITASIAALVYAVSEAPLVGFGAPDVLLAVILCVTSLAGFVVLERHHPHPLVRFEVLRLPTLRAANAITLLLGVWSGGEMIVVTLYLQEGLHYSPLLSGLAIAPQGLVGLATGLAGSRLVARLGLKRLLMLTATTTGLGLLMLAGATAVGTYPIMLAAVSLVGFGTAGTIFAATVGASNGVSDAAQGLAGGLLNMSRQIGAAIGAAVLLSLAEMGPRASGVITSVAGDREAMLAAAAVALVAVLVAGFGVRMSLSRPGRRRPSRHPIGARDSAAAAPSRSPRPVRRPAIPAAGAARIQGRELIRHEQLAQQVSKLSPLAGGERRKESLLILQMGLNRLVHDAAATVGQGDQGAASVIRVGEPADQSGSLDPVNAVGHRTGREHQGADQLSRAHLVGRAGAYQRGQYFVLTEGEAEVTENFCKAARLQQVNPGNPLQHMGGGDVESGPLPVPLPDDAIDLILFHHPIVSRFRDSPQGSTV